MITKLLPCAHCGSDDVRLMREVCTDGSITWSVSCHDCGVSTCGYPETGYDEKGKLEESYTPVSYADVLTRMEDAVDTAVTVWNSRADSCTKSSACLDLEDKSNDELVAIAKECQDVLGRKALRLLERIKETIEEDSDE